MGNGDKTRWTVQNLDEAMGSVPPRNMIQHAGYTVRQQQPFVTKPLTSCIQMACPPSKMPHQMPRPPSRGRDLLPAVSRRDSRGPPPHSSRGPPPHSSRGPPPHSSRGPPPHSSRPPPRSSRGPPLHSSQGAPPSKPSTPHTARASRDPQRTHPVEKVECLTPGRSVRHRRARPQRILGDELDGFLNKTDPQNIQVVYRAPQ